MMGNSRSSKAKPSPTTDPLTPSASTTCRDDFWTPKQAKALFDQVGVAGWSVIQKKTGGRSKAAVLSRMRREFGGGGITRGTYQLAEAIRETGYSATQFRRAADALNQRWLRTKKRGAYLITGEQLEDMVEWLSHDYWSKKLRLYCCIQCGTTERPHHTFGLCLPCHRKLARRADKAGLPWSAPRLLEWVQKLGLDGIRVQNIIVNLKAGRAPPLDDLEHLCDSTKHSPEPMPSS